MAEDKIEEWCKLLDTRSNDELMELLRVGDGLSMDSATVQAIGVLGGAVGFFGLFGHFFNRGKRTSEEIERELRVQIRTTKTTPARRIVDFICRNRAQIARFTEAGNVAGLCAFLVPAVPGTPVAFAVAAGILIFRLGLNTFCNKFCIS